MGSRAALPVQDTVFKKMCIQHIFGVMCCLETKKKFLTFGTLTWRRQAVMPSYVI